MINQTYEISAKYLFLILLMISSAAVGRSDEPNVETDEEQENSRLRLRHLTDVVKRYEVSVLNGGTEEGEPSKLIEQPLLRWTNPHSNAKDAAFFAYSRGGRPDVLVQVAIYGPKNTIHEFETTSPDQIRMTRGGAVQWLPESTNLKFEPFDDATGVADTPTRRLVQMRRLAETFRLFDDHGWKETVRQPLRLLPQPVLRYSDEDSGIIDGAVFSFVLGTDPEVTLMIEAYQAQGGPRWRYGFSAMSIYRLEAFVNDELVWQKPERRIYGVASEAHYVCPYRRQADDIDLQGRLPR